ncbi:hypothetical protein K458DRAFT_415220 [Lentithecium fluviatile CBS 122367]|uniref:Uncharacterized protein n=1 Tax=Lentithecium fluviatile CBS 122367 TaxID=1168545 RepID=A0A6G1JCD7_9PLEO|nr:hypothetical protein K458DRAFT_415220 [Lentithecium fluviatile CBS 122367]
MQLYPLTALFALLATTSASSVCDYYGKTCGSPCNKQQVGNTPLNCNTQQGASLGYTLDKPCSLKFYSGTDCRTVSQSFGSATKGCHDFIGTKGSWQFFC